MSATLLVSGLLSCYHLVAIVYTSLVVACVTVDGSTPQIDVGEDGIDTVLVEIALVAPVTIYITCNGILGRFLQVFNTHIKYRVWSSLRSIEVITAVEVCTRCHRYVVEDTCEIEIAESTQSQYLSLVGIVVARHIVWVNGYHSLSLVQHEVAIVDGRIERIPRGEGILRLNVHRVYLRQCGLVCCRCRE